MNVGKYTIGKYHAIIKKVYDDGSVDYETNFTSLYDLAESLGAYSICLNTMIGIATDNPKVLFGYHVIYGIDNIIAELGGAEK